MREIFVLADVGAEGQKSWDREDGETVAGERSNEPEVTLKRRRTVGKY